MDNFSGDPSPDILNQFLTQDLANPLKIDGVVFGVQVCAKTETSERPRNGVYGKNLIDHRFCYSSTVSGRTKWDLNWFTIT